ncbi:unnamed protein product [Candidula unifasciata]|uniref:G-protein coupled receptors family 1 profile domain-containing protein n=1 Tax=Candidula unifasciata TaxID=100452 RepID=A0A8S3YLY7_9EUPU|nr:unnamed protein product [Candidula unifasciata]
MTLSNVSFASPRKQIISNEVQLYLDIYFRTVVVTVVGVFGTITNVMSAAVFIRQGVHDCVSVCLLSLTVTNLVSVTAGVLTLFSKVLIFANILTNFDPWAIYYTLPHISALFYNISTITTTFISVERCLCVTWPLKFSNTFTVRRAVVVLMGIYLYDIIITMPDHLTMGLENQFDSKMNKTRLVLWLSPERPYVDILNRMFCQLTVESLCVLMLIVSTYSMVRGLRRSLHQWTDHHHVQQSDAIVPNIAAKKTSKGNNKVNMKQNVVNTVIILAIVAFICNSLRLVLIIIDHTHPNLATTEFNLYVDLVAVSYLLQTVNASVDIFVYLSYNISFRRRFVEMFGTSSMFHLKCSFI